MLYTVNQCLQGISTLVNLLRSLDYLMLCWSVMELDTNAEDSSNLVQLQRFWPFPDDHVVQVLWIFPPVTWESCLPWILSYLVSILLLADMMVPSQGYAYILTHPGQPCVFWDHLYDWGGLLKDEILRMVLLQPSHSSRYSVVCSFHWSIMIVKYVRVLIPAMVLCVTVLR